MNDNNCFVFFCQSHHQVIILILGMHLRWGAIASMNGWILILFLLSVFKEQLYVDEVVADRGV